MNNRLEPHSLSNERTLLASIMLYPNEIDGVAGVIESREAFYDRRHGFVYEAMLELSRENKIPEITAVIDKLKERSMLDAAGGEGYITDLIAEPAYHVQSVNVANLVANDFLRRRIISVTRDLAGMCYDSADCDAILEKAESSIFDLYRKQEKRDLVSFREVLAEAVSQIFERNKNENRLRGVSTGYAGIDEFTLGLKKGELSLLAARPSMGKTALALNICQNVAKNGVVAVFSLEMDAASLAERIISSEARVPLGEGRLSSESLESITDGLSRLSDRRLFIDDTSGISIQHMRSKLRTLMTREKRVDLIMVDYIQLMEAPNKENRQQEVSYISRSLKAIAKEFECPVLALSQLSRSSEKRGVSKKPILSDLRESGAIEQDADIVMFIHRPEYYLTEKTPPELKGIAEIIFAKQRNGKTGTLYMTWSGNITKFDDCPYDVQQAAMRVNKD